MEDWLHTDLKDMRNEIVRLNENVVKRIDNIDKRLARLEGFKKATIAIIPIIFTGIGALFAIHIF